VVTAFSSLPYTACRLQPARSSFKVAHYTMYKFVLIQILRLRSTNCYAKNKDTMDRDYTTNYSLLLYRWKQCSCMLMYSLLGGKSIPHVT